MSADGRTITNPLANSMKHSSVRLASRLNLSFLVYQVYELNLYRSIQAAASNNLFDVIIPLHSIFYLHLIYSEYEQRKAIASRAAG